MRNIPFYQHFSSYGRINPSDAKQAQIAIDFNRGKEDIQINGTILSHMLKTPDQPIQAEDIHALWQQLLIGVNNPQEYAYYQDFLDTTCHQGGLLNLLNASITESVIRCSQQKYHLPDSNQRKCQIQFMPEAKTLLLTENIRFTEMYDMQSSVTGIICSESDTPLIQATVQYRIVFEGDPLTPHVFIDSLQVESNHPTLTHVLDNRTIIQKMFDFLKSLFHFTWQANTVQCGNFLFENNIKENLRDISKEALNSYLQEQSPALSEQERLTILRALKQSPTPLTFTEIQHKVTEKLHQKWNFLNDEARIDAILKTCRSYQLETYINEVLGRKPDQPIQLSLLAFFKAQQCLPKHHGILNCIRTLIH